MEEKPNRTESRDQFDRQAALYAASPVHRFGPSLPVLLDYAELQSDDVALDIATGTGNTAIAVAEHVASVVGLDVSPGMLAQARKRAEEEGRTNARFEEGSAEALPFADASFSLVTARHAPHHFRDAGTFLQEVRRVLRPDGRFVMADGISPSPEASDWLDRWQRFRDPSHFYARTIDEWAELGTAAGLRWVKSTTVPYRLEFEWWIKQAGTPAESVAILRRIADEAPAWLRAQLGLEFDAEGNVLAFHDPMVVVRMEPITAG